MALQSNTAIATVTLQAAAPSVTFSGIPQNYRDLVIVCNTRATRVASFDYLLYRINQDTGNNYPWLIMFGSGSGSGGAQFTTLTYGVTDAQPAANRPVGEFGSAIVHLVDYSATDRQKTILNRGNDASTVVSAGVTRWTSTTAVTQIQFFMENGNIAAGSTFSLYGRIA